MKRVALQGEAEVKIIVSAPGRGRRYRRGKKGIHIASAPGDTPAPDYGDLKKKMTHEVISQGDTIIARVTSTQNYSLHLELGTERIAPRPFLRPLVERMKQAASRILGAL